MIEFIPLGKLFHGENARQHASSEHVEELARSIETVGLKQNLQGTKKRDKVFVHAGHSRLDALYLLQKRKATGHDGRTFDELYEVPVLVEKLQPVAAREASLIENVQRSQLHPLEEAEAFLALVQAGHTPETIAQRSGKSLASVQKRVRLAEGLCDEAKALLREDKLTLSQAQALTLLPFEVQRSFLEDEALEFDAGTVDYALGQNSFELRYAIFPLELYQAQGGVIVEDLYGQIPPYFADVDLAKRLQLEAATAKVEELKRKWAWAKLHLGHVAHWHYDSSNDLSVAGAIVEINERTLEVKVLGGLLEKQTSCKVEVPASLTPQPKKTNPITQSGVMLTQSIKTAALQRALLHHPESFKVALVLATLGLLREREIHLGFEKANYLDLFIVHPEVKAVFTELSAQLGLRYDADDKHNERPRVADGMALFETLLNQNVETLHHFFVSLVATAVGTWVCHTNSVEDTTFAVQLAQCLEAKLESNAVTDDWLKTLSLERLIEIASDLLGHAVVGSFTKKQLRALILEVLPKRADYLPRELTFHNVRVALAANNVDEMLPQAA
jgi:ParB/RepB/Spo0J family partition protein